ncbi:helix-turn-helix domain-containing protein [Amycolatopsis palatopharyngis]|uniref:helix-turn-helix domain-containing protein n=1 Tax=Amycolatopsis palatopharyngis TaxID=187982 RepID=UPI000E25212A|nr:helix-turn-helix transcriptional regulator [Amycolatopsis palatopharyngis]
MSEQQSPPFRRRRLGRTLRDLRESARMSPAEVCARLEFSPARLSRMENGQTAPDIVIVKSLLDEYGIPVNDWEPYLELAREAKQKGWWQAHGLPAMGYVALEAAANSVWDFALAYVPGLLQSRGYVEAVLRASTLRRTEQQVQDQIAVRMRRQHRLLSEDGGLELIAVVDEGVLHRTVGGLEVMRDQLRHITNLAATPTVTVHVVPSTVGVHVGMEGAFTVLAFPEADDPDIAYLEHVTGALQLEKKDEVRACRLTFELLRNQALDPTDSIGLIKRLAQEM